MPMGILYWLLLILWFIFGLYWNWPANRNGYGLTGGHVLLFVLFFLLGWRVFGFVIQ